MFQLSQTSSVFGFNYFQLIPDYDMKTKPNPMPDFIHEDVDFISDILGIRVSFYWRPLITNNLTDTLRLWVSPNETTRPFMIVLSMQLNIKNF